MRLSIVIPAYNEEARLGDMLDDYAKYFAGRYGDDVELVVVVNGSRDQTEEVARARVASHPQVKVIVEPAAIGKGGAVMRGFAVARGALIGFVDADNATSAEAFQDLVEHIGDAGAIIASRWIEGARVSPKQPIKRIVASRIFNAMVRTFFGLRIHDTQCGAKLFSREAVLAVLPHIGITRWAFDVDILFQMRRGGFRIVEWPTTWRDAAGSRLKVSRASFEMFVAICRLRLVYSPLRWVVTGYDMTLGRIFHPKARNP